MAFKFSVLCDLLQSLEDIHRHDPPLLLADRKTRQWRETDGWFKSHRRAIDGLDVVGAAALLSCLLPERRTDRVYGLQSNSLASNLARQLGFSASKTKDLNVFKRQGHGDLGDCLERVLTGGGPPALPVVTLGEIDRVLLDLASRNDFSSPAVKQRKTSTVDPLFLLANIVRRLHPVEAKWLVRIVLKDLSVTQLDERLILKSIHFLLPDILRFQQDFDAAVHTLKDRFATHQSCPDNQSATQIRKLVSASHRPIVGVKVSRSTFCKARSIDHCMKTVDKQHWMVERKYDGEFCEMHIDLSKGDDWLKIFSKSGKDSTQDRRALKTILKGTLAIGKKACKIKSECILLGEMVVYNEAEKQIMPFHTIRKYVQRSGTYIGVSRDSPRKTSEHLMIIFFDLLLLDDNVTMQKPAEERKALLNRLCITKTGQAIIVESKVLNFADQDSKRKLIEHFAAAVTDRHEGLVLKPCGRPYLSTDPGERDTSTMIKLKKDYMDGLGDEADMAVIGASYNAQLASTKGLDCNSYTHFHVACLLNPEDVDRYQARARYKVVGTISCDGCIPPDVLPQANHLARLHKEAYHPGAAPSSFDVQTGTARIDVIFPEPFVFEVLGSSFEKPSDCNHWMLRHPRVKKLHSDRSWKDCISFTDLQKLARQALSAPPDSESQENLRWIERIEKSCRRKIARASAQTTPTSRTTTPSVSPRGRAYRSGLAASAVLTSPIWRVRQEISVAVNETAGLEGGLSSPLKGIRSSSVIPESPTSTCYPEDVSRAIDDAENVGEDPAACKLQEGLPTPPTSSPLKDGANKSTGAASKRKGDQVSLPEVKRACLAARFGYKSSHAPLADITHIPNQRLPSNFPPSSLSLMVDTLVDKRIMALQRAFPGRDFSWLADAAHAAIVTGIRANICRHECAILRAASKERERLCRLSHCMVYVEDRHSPSGAVAVAHALSHGARVAYSLEEWLAYPSSYSQANLRAYSSTGRLANASANKPALQKVYHLDYFLDDRYPKVLGIYRRLKRLGAFRDQVDFIDVVVMSMCCGLVETRADHERLFQEDWRKFRIGKSDFNPQSGERSVQCDVEDAEIELSTGP
ncbi:hypothetical protein K461DRAFT_278248 [Myriangium duriaei CBS 260.36]|uniref:ATP-dependent DNA ligase family profile domain-containing protein n=1 Tax=Myriangium duriaei CBS 260.36 TaxID=1168546 RepID=A0A9P4J6R8_9PEZI|nr:hypothetical protein K461DRAFT_278248 [Myriangium duriaei CBS 260.36]